MYLERSVKAWGLWGGPWRELSGDTDLNAIQIASGDHRAMALDGDQSPLRQPRTRAFAKEARRTENWTVGTPRDHAG